MDLRDLWAPGGRLTFRLARVLINRLPAESALKSAIRDSLTDDEAEAQRTAATDNPGFGPWSHSEMLLALISDQLKWLEYAVYRSQGGKPRKPEPYPRPGVEDKTKKNYATGTDTVVPLNEAGLQALRRLRERGDDGGR